MRFEPLLLLMACTANPSGASRLDRVPAGEWGGEHVRLTVEDGGGKVEFDCAHGSLDAPLMLDPEGRFDVPGRLAFEGGPTRRGEAEDARPARYRGQTDSGRMTLEVTLESGESAGRFSLARNGPARLVKCR